MDPRESGTLLHDVLETLYAPYRNVVLTEAQLVKMEANFEGLLLELYRKFHSGNPNRHGKNHLIFEAIKAYGKALLAYEKKQINAGHELKIIALEQEVSLSIKLASGALVRLKGIIDRVDYFDGQLRIIDYKTGENRRSRFKNKTVECLFRHHFCCCISVINLCLNVYPPAAFSYSRDLCFTKHQ